MTKHPSILVLTLYLLLTLLMTWPTAYHLTDSIPGDGFDGWQNYWNLWWVKHALLVEGTNPYFTDLLYAPTGVSLLFHTLNIFNGLWTVPLQLNFGLAVSYNSVVILSFVLAGYGGYLLSLFGLTQLKRAFSTSSPSTSSGNEVQRGLSLSKAAPDTPHSLHAAAFVGGLIFTMSPFHFAHLLGHMQVFSLIWPPFYVLWLLRTLSTSRSATAKAVVNNEQPWRQDARNIVLSALFLSLTTLVALYHTLYLLMLTALVLLWIIWQTILPESKPSGLPQTILPESKPSGLPQTVKGLASPTYHLPSTIYRLTAIGLLFGLLMSPLLIALILNASQRPDLETGLEQNIALSADLLAYVLPSEMHPLWGEWARSIADNFTSTTSERLIFVGFTPLILSLIALIVWRKSRQIWLWAMLAACFVILSFGPYLHLNGQILSLGEWPIPMPYLLLYHTVPFIDLTRSLSRYALIVMLMLGVLSAMGLWWLMGRARRPLLIAAIATLLICLEFLPIPYPMSPIQMPQFYRDIATDGQNYTLAVLPMNWDRPEPLLHQTVHQKPLLTAYTSRDNPLELARRTPVLQQWRTLRDDIIAQPLADIAPTIFYDVNLRYIVLDYWQMPPGPERDLTEQWVNTALPDATPIYDDGRLRVYQTPSKIETRPYLTLGDGWGDFDPTRQARRVATDGATLLLHHPQGQPLTLNLTTSSPDEAATLTLSTLGEQVGTVTTGATQSIRLPASEARWLRLHLHTDSAIWVEAVRVE